MSLRRLAPPDVQPASFAFNAANAEWAKATVAKYPAGRQASAVIPLLWRGQEQEGWVSHPMIEEIAKMLAMPSIRVLEVATFYTMFNRTRVGKYHLQMCGTTPCKIRGAREVIQAIKDYAKIEMDETSEDGLFTLSEVECLGACVNAPMMQVNNEYVYEVSTSTCNEYGTKVLVLIS